MPHQLSRLGWIVALLLGLMTPLVSALPAAAQQPIVTWTHELGPGANLWDVAVDALGHVYVAGTSDGSLPGQTPAGGQDAFVAQFRADGSLGWMHQFGTAGADVAAAIALDAAGNLDVAGTVYYGALPGQTNAGAADVFVRQYAPDGSERWTRQFGTATFDEAFGLAVDAGGNLYVTGEIEAGLSLPGQSSAGARDVFVRQYQSDGSEGWTRQFGTGADDLPSGIVVHGNSLYVVGNTTGTLPGQTNPGVGTSVFVRQYQLDGTLGWTRQFGDMGVAGIAVGGGGNLYVAGSTPWSSSAVTQAVVRQFRADSSDGWSQRFAAPADVWFFGAAVDAAGDVYVTGQTSGSVFGQASAGMEDALVARLQGADGSLSWGFQFGTNDSDAARRIAIDGTGNVYLAASLARGGALVKLRPTDTPATNPATLIGSFSNVPDRSYFPETGHSLALGFKAFWGRNGGLPVFGYPLTEEFPEQNYTVQYLERQRFEWHPEFAGTPYEVELGRLGVTDAQRRGLLWTGTPAFQPLPADTGSDANCRFFVETGHRLCSGFKEYWQSHGLDFGDAGTSYRESLALFGYPISEEFVDPATGCVTQYFERAVFEYHPENAGTPYTVLLRRLGAEELQARDW